MAQALVDCSSARPALATLDLSRADGVKRALHAPLTDGCMGGSVAAAWATAYARQGVPVEACNEYSAEYHARSCGGSTCAAPYLFVPVQHAPPAVPPHMSFVAGGDLNVTRLSASASASAEAVIQAALLGKHVVAATIRPLDSFLSYTGT